MLRKKKTKEQGIVEDLSTEKTTQVIHENPLICMFDIDRDVIDCFREKSYNCTRGSLGKLVRVPNNNRNNEHYLKPNHYLPDNLHEYDILIFDMGDDTTINYNSSHSNLDNVTDKETYMFLSTFPQKIFNPKPYATQIISESINYILKKESIVIIFSDQNEQVEYQLVKIDSYENRITDSYSRTNTCFYDGFPDCYNKIGSKMKSPKKQTKLTPLLLKYAEKSKYDLVFNHPYHWDKNKKVYDNTFIPLLLNNDDEIVSYYHSHSKGTVFVFPQFANKKDFLLELFNNYLPELFPELFPFHGQFGWLNNGEYPLPGEVELRAQKEEIENKYIEDIKDNEKAQEQIKEDFHFLRDLVSESGDKLVEAVEHYLKWLGFKSVVNCDDTSPEIFEEDLQVDCGDRFLVVEIKGIGGTSTDKDCSQISKIKYRRSEQRGKFDVFGLYIVNHQRYMPPKSRSNPPFTEHQLNDAKLDKRGLLTTYQLYRAYFLIESGFLKKEDAREQLFETGLVSLSPTNLKSIGMPTEYFKKGKIAILNIQNTVLKKGDEIIVWKQDRFIKLNIVSLMVDDVEIDEVDSGEVGIKFSDSIKKNSEIYIEQV